MKPPLSSWSTGQIDFGGDTVRDVKHEPIHLFGSDGSDANSHLNEILSVYLESSPPQIVART